MMLKQKEYYQTLLADFQDKRPKKTLRLYWLP